VGKNKYIFSFVTANFNNFPEFSYEFSHFMLNYSASEEVADLVFNNALQNPSQYEYVEGTYWELLSKFKIDSTSKRRYIKHAINRLKESTRKEALKFGLYIFISTTGNGLVLKWLQYEKSPLLQAFAIKYIHDGCFDTPTFREFSNFIMRRTSYEPAAMLIKRLIFSYRKDIQRSLDKSTKDYSGVISNLQGSPKTIDPIGEILSKRYAVKLSTIWTNLLGTDVDHANEILYMSEKSFHIDKNSWISYLDSFNDLVFRRFISLIVSTVTPPKSKHWPSLVNKNGESIDYGILLDPQNQISQIYPDLTSGLRNFHIRRSKSPTSHAFNKKTGLKSQIILSKEQKILVAELNKSYTLLITETQKYV
jgi:hypothetical protein